MKFYKVLTLALGALALLNMAMAGLKGERPVEDSTKLQAWAFESLVLDLIQYTEYNAMNNVQLSPGSFHTHVKLLHDIYRQLSGNMKYPTAEFSMDHGILFDSMTLKNSTLHSGSIIIKRTEVLYEQANSTRQKRHIRHRQGRQLTWKKTTLLGSLLSEASRKLDSLGCLNIKSTTCSLENSIKRKLVECGFIPCVTEKCNPSIQRATKDCLTAFSAITNQNEALESIQPSIEYFHDNNPPHRQRRIMSVSVHKLALSAEEQKIKSCNKEEPSEPINGICKIVSSGDFNSLYTTYEDHQVVNGTSEYVMVLNSDYWVCDPPNPIWKDVKIVPGHPNNMDSYIYDIGFTGQMGFEPELCILKICTICVIRKPVMLGGKCKVTFHVVGHPMIKVCNNENTKLGYYIRPVHAGGVLSAQDSLESRFILQLLFKAIRNGIWGAPVMLVSSTTIPYSLKDSLGSGECKNHIIADTNAEWIYTYVKCGSTIFQHNEHFDKAKRCVMAYDNGKLTGRIIISTCKGWYIIRFIVVFLSLSILTTILKLVKLKTYICAGLNYLTSPFAYILFKIWPTWARCKKCMYPWSPFHTCPKYCVCGSSMESPNHYCPLTKLKFQKIESELDENMLTGKDQRTRIKNMYFSLKNKLSMVKDNFDYQIFSSRYNPYTSYTTMTFYLILLYVLCCFLVPVSLASCIKCTDDCYIELTGTGSCTNPAVTCTCSTYAECVVSGNYTRVGLISRSQDATTKTRERSYTGCLKVPKDAYKEYYIRIWIFQLIDSTKCFTELTRHENWVTYMNSVVRNMRVFHVASMLNKEIPKDCKSFMEWLDTQTEVDVMDYLTGEALPIPLRRLKNRRIEGAKGISIIPKPPNVLPDNKDNKDGKDEGNQKPDNDNDNEAGIDDHGSHEISIVPLVESLPQNGLEKNVRSPGSLDYDLQTLMTLLHYNGSIYGRDHSIIFPDPPSSYSHVYTIAKVDGNTAIDMTIPARAGSSVSFRPVHEGEEIPLTVTLSIPEVAGVYKLKYHYTTCETKYIDILSYNKCTATCNTCYQELKDEVVKYGNQNWLDINKHASKEWESPNTWGCEGSGCWTIGTGCLCSYCSNIPDPNNCMDVYSLDFLMSKALFCMGMNEKQQCEHVELGEPINKNDKIQILLTGSDTWSKHSKSDLLAIDHKTGKVYEGQILGLGESGGNFGTPQYARNFSLLYKENNYEASYECRNQEIQKIIATTCFSDTWIMRSSLKESFSFFMDSSSGILYQTGTYAGDLKVTVTIPVDKIKWEFSNPSLKITAASCTGCYKCINGVTCNIIISSDTNGLFLIYSEPGYMRIPTINILRGTRPYNITLDIDTKVGSVSIKITDRSHKEVYAEKRAKMDIKDGNDPRDMSRNTTNRDYGITGGAGVWDFFSGIDLGAVGSFFKSGLVHFLLWLLIWALMVALVVGALIWLGRKIYDKFILSQVYDKKQA